jgi:hypothetical protein
MYREIHKLLHHIMNKHSVSAVRRGFAVVVVFASFWVFCNGSAPRATAQSTDMLTYHNDSGRTGQNSHEEILAPTNVDFTNFGLLRILSTDGRVDAQPLYAAGVSIPGKGVHNVVFIATEHDSVYAFDADSTNLFWKVSMLGTNEAPSDDHGCGQVTPEIGVTATPVIDRALGTNGTMFLVALSKIAGTATYIHRVHALDLSTGVNLTTPTVVTARFKGTGDNSDGTNVIFDPAKYVERCGLLLLGGVVYTAWSSHCDSRLYTGWVMGYDEQTLAQTSVIDVTPNGNEGAIWMAGDGLAADSSSNIYFLDGNGTFDTTLDPNGFPTNHDFGNAFIKLSTTSNVLAVADYFNMSTTVTESGGDKDLGSGGALVLPDMIDGLGQARQLAVGAGKDSNIYLVDRTNMGKFNPANDNAIYQELDGVLPGGVWAMPTYFNGTLYYGSVSQKLKAFPFQNARLAAVSSQTPGVFGYPGVTPSVSANGNLNGIVWALENVSPSVLHAYAATNLGVEAYNSNQATNRDHFGSGNKFVTPMIASARVYAGTPTGVGVFGLLNQSTLTPLQVWRDNHFGNPSNVGAGANTASPAGDGVPNLLKYALGLDPNTPATSGQLPTGGIQPDSGQDYLTMTINRTNRPADISYVVEVSGDLQTWVSGPPNTVTLTDTATQLVVRDNIPVPGATERFIRLRVTVP